jgi:hypothetical protein
MLTQISAGFDNPIDYVGPRLFPSVSVAKQSDKYYVFNRDTWGRVTDDIRQPGSEANELPPMTLSRDTFFVEEHALEDVVPDEEVENADSPLQPAADAAMRLTNTVLLNRENIQVVMATTTSNYASGYSTTLSGTTQWSDYTNSVPITDIRVGVKKIHDFLFRDPNTFIFGYNTYWQLQEHPKVLARITYATPQVADDSVISSVLGIPNFTVAGGGKLTSAYGATETADYVMSKDVVMAYVPPSPGRRTPSYGYEFVEPYGGAGPMPTERWREEKRKSDVVRVSRRYDNKFITVDGSGLAQGGYLIKNAVA